MAAARADGVEVEDSEDLEAGVREAEGLRGAGEKEPPKLLKRTNYTVCGFEKAAAGLPHSKRLVKGRDAEGAEKRQKCFRMTQN